MVCKSRKRGVTMTDLWVEPQACPGESTLEVDSPPRYGRVAFPLAQHVFIQGEEDAFPIEFKCGQPITLTDDVRRHQESVLPKVLPAA